MAAVVNYIVYRQNCAHYHHAMYTISHGQVFDIKEKAMSFASKFGQPHAAMRYCTMHSRSCSEIKLQVVFSSEATASV